MPQLDYLSQFLLSIQMLNIKSMFFGLHWWLSTGCLPTGAEPLHQRVWWEEKAEDGVGRKGRERGRMTGSREELGAGGCPDMLEPVPLCGELQAPQTPSGTSAQVGSCQEGQGSTRGSGNWSQYCSHPVPPSTSSLTKT